MTKFFFGLILIILFSCKSDTNQQADGKAVASKTEFKSETEEMSQLLLNLIKEGDPKKYYHWNKERAQLAKQDFESATDNRRNLWLKYCQELIKAGDNQTCIDEIESMLHYKKLSYNQLVNAESKDIIETLALAYLRLGEVRNCQKNHNAFSCILPLTKEAQHTDIVGSQKAKELYTLLYSIIPNERYRWLLNLAHMTLGTHPAEVPKEYLVAYPNFKKESGNFPPFQERATHLGIAQNGLSGGVCVDDFNNDGRIDIFATSYGMGDQVKLYLNTTNGFEDATESAGLQGIVSGLNCNHMDYNNDGHKDIFILRGGWLGEGGAHPNSLLKNNGDGSFTDVTKSAGILSFHPTQTAAWADINNDGYLDVFIGNETNGPTQHACELYINQKDGTFKEMAIDHQLGNIRQFVKGVTFGDINNDNYPDLYLSILGGKNRLYKNNKGLFENISNSSKITEPINSFPCWFWDVNNDGYQDIFVSDYDVNNLNDVAGDFAREIINGVSTTVTARLYINQGDETFKDKTRQYRVNRTLYAMGCNYGDLDNDGWLDFYVGNGAPDLTSVIPNRMFRNNQGQNFEEVTSSGRFGHIQKGHGVGFADFDMDGDQDIYAVMGGAYEGDEFPNIYFENPSSENKWIVLDLEGTLTNKSAIGTVIQLELANGRKIFHTISTGTSFGSNSLQAEIGIGKSESIKSIKINWPSGNESIFENVAANKKYKITEEDDSLKNMPYEKFSFETKKGHHHHHH